MRSGENWMVCSGGRGWITFRQRVYRVEKCKNGQHGSVIIIPTQEVRCSAMACTTLTHYFIPEPPRHPAAKLPLQSDLATFLIAAAKISLIANSPRALSGAQFRRNFLDPFIFGATIHHPYKYHLIFPTLSCLNNTPTQPPNFPPILKFALRERK